MNRPNPSIDELLLDGSFVLLVSDVGELDGCEGVVLFRDPIPNEGEWIFTHAFAFFDNRVEVLLSLLGLSLAVVQNGSKLEELLSAQTLDINHVDVSPAILKLLFAIDQVRVQLLDWGIAERLTDGGH